MKNKNFDPVPHLGNLPFPVESNRDLEKDIIICEKVEFLLMLSLNNDSEVIKWLPGFAYDKFRVTAKNYIIDRERPTSNVNAIAQLDFENDFAQRVFELPDFKDVLYPLIRLYCIVNEYQVPSYENMDLTAGYQLAHEFRLDTKDIFKPLPIPDGSPWKISFNKNIHPRNLPKITSNYQFLGEKGILLQQIVERKTSQGIVRLPAVNWIKDNEPYPITTHFYQFDKHPIFNLNLIKEYRHAPIFLTEHIDIAQGMFSGFSLIWTSWNGGKDAMEYVDWQSLKGRKVYYVLLLDNSPKDKERIETAMAVFTKFDDAHGMNLQVVLVRQQAMALPVSLPLNTLNHDVRYMHPSESSVAPESQKQKVIPENMPEQLPPIQVLDDTAFIKLARQYKIYIPEDISEYVDGRINTNLTKKHEPIFLVTPILKEKTLTVIFAPAGIGKTWLGLSMGLCLSNGIDIFPHWKVSPAPRKVLYVLGEMDREEIENRVCDIKKGYQIKADNKYLMTRRVYDKDISESKGQMRVEKYIRDLNNLGDGMTSVLILDNLNTLAENASFKAGWDRLFAWIEKIKRSGITVILIHHTNKDGKYLGTSNIKNKADFMIHASETNEVADKLHKLCAGSTRSSKDKKLHEIKQILIAERQEEIVMYINHKKHRSVSKKDSKPLRIAIDPEDDNPKWDVKVMDYEEILSGYGYSQEDLTKIIESDHLDEKFQRILYDEPTDENDDDIFPLDIAFLDMPEERQKEIILKLYERGKTPHERSSWSMAKKLNISKRALDYVRAKTKTKFSDLKVSEN